MAQNVFRDSHAQLGHAFSKPRRDTSGMKRQVRKSRALHQDSRFLFYHQEVYIHGLGGHARETEQLEAKTDRVGLGSSSEPELINWPPD